MFGIGDTAATAILNACNRSVYATGQRAFYEQHIQTKTKQA
jgi:hypothetical protein